MDSFILLALLGGIALAGTLAILGNFLIWSRTSYLGDSLAHSSLLGLVIAGILPLSIFSAVQEYLMDGVILVVCFLFAFALIFLNKRFDISKEVLLVFNTQFSLAAAFALLSFFLPNKNINNYFLGNILSLDAYNIIVLYALFFMVMAFVWKFWDKILLLVINKEIYNSEYKDEFLINLIFAFLLCAVVVFAIKIAGVLLIPSLLIIPGLIVQKLTHNTFFTIVLSVIVAIIAVIIGIIGSMFIDIPTGPLITLTLVSILISKFVYLEVFRK